MSLSSFTVCMNALRLNLFNLHDARHDKKRKNPAADLVEKADLAPQPAACPVPAAAGTQVTYQVKGMMCAHCEGRVKKALEGLDGVTSAKADHNSGTVEVTETRNVPENDFKSAILKSGYEYEGMD